MMKPSVIYRWNDVVVARFPFAEGDRFKPRPALILSSEGFNRQHDQIIVAMITSGAGSLWPSDVPIADLASAGLSKRCVVRWKILTILRSDFGPTIGRLGPKDRARVAEAQRSIFALR
jgi:mRNA interferase MazF